MRSGHGQHVLFLQALCFPLHHIQIIPALPRYNWESSKSIIERDGRPTDLYARMLSNFGTLLS